MQFIADRTTPALDTLASVSHTGGAFNLTAFSGNAPTPPTTIGQLESATSSAATNRLDTDFTQSFNGIGVAEVGYGSDIAIRMEADAAVLRDVSLLSGGQEDRLTITRNGTGGAVTFDFTSSLLGAFDLASFGFGSSADVDLSVQIFVETDGVTTGATGLFAAAAELVYDFRDDAVYTSAQSTAFDETFTFSVTLDADESATVVTRTQLSATLEQTAVVPVPAGLPLALGGLGALLALRHTRR